MKFTDPMPRQIRRGHSEPAWKGDRAGKLRDQRKAIDAAKRAGKPLPAPSLDMNFQWFWRDPEDHTKGGEFRNLHWRNPAMNNYRWIVRYDDPTRTRRMTAKELVRTSWTAEQVSRWRRGPALDSAHPSTYRSLAKVANDVEVYITAEIKNMGGASPYAAAQFVADAKAADHPPWSMALLSMPYSKGKAVAMTNAAVKAGLKAPVFALIFGRFTGSSQRPSDFSSWPPVMLWTNSRRILAWKR